MTLPSVGMPAGDNVILIAARDRSGNRSETRNLAVRLYTQQQIDDLALAQTSTVKGQLLYGRLPQGKLKVDLLKVPPEDIGKTAATVASAANATSAQDATALDQEPVASTLSLEDGSFRFPAVPSGHYVVRVTGVVRGNAAGENQKANRGSSKNIAPILWRLDVQP